MDIKDILDNSDDMTAGRIAEKYPALSDDEKERLFAMSVRKFNNDDLNFDAVEQVSGVEAYKRPKWYKAAGIAAAAVIAVSIAGGGVMYLKDHGVKQPDRAAENADISAALEGAENSQSLFTSGTEKKSVRTLMTAPEPSSADKEDVYHLLLHTIDYFDSASGRVYSYTVQNGCANMTDFSISMSEPSAYNYRRTYKIDDISRISEEYFSKCELVQSTKHYCDRTSYYDTDELNDTHSEGQGICMKTFDELYPEDKRELFDIPDSQRVSYDADGERHTILMPDPTNMVDSSISLFPQSMAMGYFSDTDLWEIDGISEFDGRQCYEVSGTASSSYGEQQNVSDFNACIDCKTGVLLKFEGYDSSGQLRRYIYTENISFDDIKDQ